MTPIDVLPKRLMAASGAGLCLLALGVILVDPRAALTGWLSAFVFITAIPLGSLCLLLMMRIIPGRWREELQPAPLAAQSLPLAILAAVPILVGVPWIYEWAASTKLSSFQSVYLTPVFFSLRTLGALIGAAWLGFAIARGRASKSLAIGGLIIFVIFQDLLAVDWLMSLDPTFHSSGFGLYILSGQLLTALAALILLRLAVGTNRDGSALLSALLLVALLFWAYLAFMQYFIIWSGNLPQGVVWYQRRGQGGWVDVEYAITVLHLAPLLALLFPPARTRRRILALLCGLVLVGGFLECAWLTLPVLPSGLGVAAFCDIAASIGLGMLTLALIALASVGRPERRVLG